MSNTEQNFEQKFDQLGEFYLGTSRGEVKSPALLAAEDLTTHAFIVGMTGSGKTGLAIDLLEEALIDDVPVIIIDPKGDLANLGLQFPNVRSAEATPWLESGDKSLADQQAHWEKLRGYSGITGERIQNLRDKLAVRVFTPGSANGLPVNTIPLSAPNTNNSEILDARANAISLALLSRVGEASSNNVNPAQVFLAQILLTFWKQGQTVTLGGLLGAIQSPPFDTIGFLDVDVYFSDKQRHALMLKLNTLIASPGFNDWLTGPALDIPTYYAIGQSKVPVTIFSIAHLSEDDRQFFVQLLLAEIITWMRQQSGSDALRALLYMDEIAGYIPPVSNPPSKAHFLTLLKQARAYGLGLVLATQNPVDLDYKGLSNIGTWLIGRLQTERDRDRLLDGLERLRDGELDAAELLSSLEKREFLLHSVHMKQQVVFYTRCTQALLIGPMPIEQLKAIPNRVEDKISAVDTLPNNTTNHLSAQSPQTARTSQADEATTIPIVNPRIRVRYAAKPENDYYEPMLAAELNVFYEDKTTGASSLTPVTLLVNTDNGDLDWANAQAIKDEQALAWSDNPVQSITFETLPDSLQKLTPYSRSKTLIKKSALPLVGVELLHYAPLDILSGVNEEEMRFRARVVDSIRAQRMEEKTKLKATTQKKLDSLEAKRDKLLIRLEKEKSESLSAKVSSWAKAGGAILSAFMGSKALSVSNANKISSTINSVGRARKQAQDVENVEAQLNDLEQQLNELSSGLEQQIQALEAQQPTLTALPIQTKMIAPKQSDIEITQCFLAWK